MTISSSTNPPPAAAPAAATTATTTAYMPVMFADATSSPLTVLGCISVLALTACYFCPSKLLRWIERKRYQYEVTFSLYMLTPTEKFIFNSILFLFLSMVTIAASLYLPEHITFVVRRAFYYVAGDFEHSASRLSQTVIQTAVKTAAAITSSAPGSVVKDAVETVKEVIGAGAAAAAGGEL